MLNVVFREDKLRSKGKKGIHNLGLIRRFVMFIIKLLKVYYHRSMKRVRNKIGRNLETEIPVINQTPDLQSVVKSAGLPADLYHG